LPILVVGALGAVYIESSTGDGVAKRSQPEQGRGPAGAAEELPSRLVMSLLYAAVRVAARVEMPLHRLTDLLRTAYFLEHRRRHPRDLATVAEKLDVSLRTAGSLNRSLREDFYAPETRVEPLRLVTSALLEGPCSLDRLEVETGLDTAEVRRTVHQLGQVGWVELDESGIVKLTGTLRSFVAEDVQRRVDAVNHQLAIIAESVWSTFVRQEQGKAGARTWSFAAKPEAVAEVLQRTFANLRAEAVALEEDALADGVHHRFGITVAIAPLEDDR
jgi:Mn-dependent DtxR family transcriptional regulator